MDPISNTDRLVLLLRQKLAERAKTATPRSAERQEPARGAPPEPTGLDALAAVETADEHTLGRALLQHLLADQLAPELINDAKFQEVVSRVTEAILEYPDAAKLLARLVRDLRGPN
jgi:hypothetical protein